MFFFSSENKNRFNNLKTWEKAGSYSRVFAALGTLRNHKMSKTTTLHVHHAFLYISLQSLHKYEVKWPNFMFTWGRERQGDNFYHLCQNLGVVPSLQLQPKFPSFK